MSLPLHRMEEAVRCLDSRDRFSCIAVAVRIAPAAGLSRRASMEVAKAACVATGLLDRLRFLRAKPAE